MTSKSDIEHWQINATVYTDKVVESHFVTDALKNKRRELQTVVWHVEKFLGRGGFGEVRLERNRESKRDRAVKKIATSKPMSNSECERELKALLEFSKPKYREAAVFVDFLGWFRNDVDVFLAMEYLPLGDLEMNVAVAHSGRISESEAQDIAQQILSGLEIMHAESFAHRDLKPQNVLVVYGPPKWWVKLADFGLSKKLTEATAYRTKSGTQSYMAPETLEYLETETLCDEYTNAVDLWAVGCITYRLVTGIVPFPHGKSLMKYCEDKSLFPYDALLDSGIKSPCAKFIRELLETYPKSRPSASQALNHTWITSCCNAGKFSEQPRSQTLEKPGLSDYIASAMVYNTSTHDGLRSDRTPLPSHTKNCYVESSRPSVIPKSLVTSDSDSSDKQVYTEEGRTEPPLAADNSETLSSTEQSAATLEQVSAKKSSTLGPQPVILEPKSVQVKSKPQDKVQRTIFEGIPLMFKVWKRDDALRTLKGHIRPVVSVAFSPNSNVVASASQDRTVRLWDPATGIVSYTLNGHTCSVTSLALSHNGNMVASASFDSTIRIWDVATGACLHILSESSPVSCVAFSPNSKVVASGLYNGIVSLWDSATSIALRTLSAHLGYVSSVVFSPNGKVVASASADKTVRILDAATGTSLQTLIMHTNNVVSVAFSPDSNVLASTSSDSTVRVWDIATGTSLLVFKEHRSCVYSVAFSPNGKVIASASLDMTVRLWDAATGTVLWALREHKDSVNSVAFSPNGKVVASASDDKTVRLWNVETGAALQTLKGHTKRVCRVAFSHDSKMLASASWDTTVRLWEIAEWCAESHCT